MTTRRRILRGLSAASVVGALPLFVRRGAAQRTGASHTIRVACVDIVANEVELAVHLRASAPLSILEGDFRVPSGELRWPNGRRAAISPLEGRFTSSRALRSRRLPRARTLTLAEGEEARLGFFVLEAERGVPPEARFVLEVAGQRHSIDWMVLDVPGTGVPSEAT